MTQNNEEFTESLIVRFGRFIRFSHTVFALPFAFIAMLAASQGWPEGRVFFLIFWCMVCARSAAMLFNRLVDWDFDKKNPRTEGRHRLISKPIAWISFLLFVVLFTGGSWMLNSLCLFLSPVALFLICFYSLTKRFTSLCHFFLGLALSAAPMGAWIAVTGEMYALAPYSLALGVLCWVFGFDLIYATLDMEFDRKTGLNSFPARFGVKQTLLLSKALHLLSVVAFAWFGYEMGFGMFYGGALIGVCAALIWEQYLSASQEVEKINKAFFQVNTVVSLLLLGGVVLEII